MFVNKRRLHLYCQYGECSMWKRPESVPLGRVWMRFPGRDKPGEQTRRYQIRDMEGQYKEECLALMETSFLRDEPLCQVFGVKSDRLSVSEIRANWEDMLRQQVSLCCFLEEDGAPTELVGFNILTVKTDADPKGGPEMKGKPWRKLLDLLVTAESLVDVFAHYSVDKYITSSGLSVLPEHRGQNIGARMIHARKELCRAFGIGAVATVFTATASQVLAAKCDYEILATLKYSALKYDGVDLTGCTTPCALYMGIKYQLDNQTHCNNTMQN